MKHLLDVNVLLALAWPNHQFHAEARSWFGAHGSEGWCTCALTQLGFIRLSSNPAYTPHARTPVEATRMLGDMTEHQSHVFVEALPACTVEPFHEAAARLQGHRQTTDAYLATLAHHHGLGLVTFDRRIERACPIEGVVRVIS